MIDALAIAPTRRSFVVGASSLLLASTANFSWAQKITGHRRFAYVGSVSASKAVLPDSTTGKGEGIYVFEADLDTGALTSKSGHAKCCQSMVDRCQSRRNLPLLRQ